LLQRPVEINSPGAGTIDDAATAIPAFIRMKDDRRITFYRIGYIYVHLTDFDTPVTPDTYLGIEYDLSVWSSKIR
jgi:hypothetical protein